MPINLLREEKKINRAKNHECMCRICLVLSTSKQNELLVKAFLSMRLAKMYSIREHIFRAFIHNYIIYIKYASASLHFLPFKIFLLSSHLFMLNRDCQNLLLQIDSRLKLDTERYFVVSNPHT